MSNRFVRIGVNMSGRAQQREQHHARLVGQNRMKQTGGHVDPGARAELEGFAIEIETDPARNELDDGRQGGRVIGELLSGVKAKTTTRTWSSLYSTLLSVPSAETSTSVAISASTVKARSVVMEADHT